MSQGISSDVRWARQGLIAATATLSLLGLPALGQHAAAGAPTTRGVGQSMTRPVAGPSASTRPATPMTRPAGVPVQRGGQGNRGAGRAGINRSDVLGPNSSAPKPTWEIPRNITPHWEIPSYNNVQPNYVQGNPANRRRARYGGIGYGVGYVGIPYSGYGDSTAFFGADSGDETAQQAQPNGPGRPDYAPDDPCGEAGCPPDGPFYPAPGRQQLSQQQQPARELSPAESAAAQSNGLDHPEVTLVFNDGRPVKKVRSYVLTGSAVFVSENGRQTKIPIADLNMPATVSRNRDAGVDFTLPGAN